MEIEYQMIIYNHQVVQRKLKVVTEQGYYNGSLEAMMSMVKKAESDML